MIAIGYKFIVYRSYRFLSPYPKIWKLFMFWQVNIAIVLIPTCKNSPLYRMPVAAGIGIEFCIIFQPKMISYSEDILILNQNRACFITIEDYSTHSFCYGWIACSKIIIYLDLLLRIYSYIYEKMPGIFYRFFTICCCCLV